MEAETDFDPKVKLLDLLREPLPESEAETDIELLTDGLTLMEAETDFDPIEVKLLDLLHEPLTLGEDESEAETCELLIDGLELMEA
jgi:hypothetical protein